MLSSFDDASGCDIKLFKTAFMTRFDATDEGPVTQFLGIDVDYDREGGTLKISQQTTIDALLYECNICQTATAQVSHCLRDKSCLGRTGILIKTQELQKIIRVVWAPYFGSSLYATRHGLCCSPAIQISHCPRTKSPLCVDSCSALSQRNVKNGYHLYKINKGRQHSHCGSRC
jgi:hypothetical protein